MAHQTKQSKKWNFLLFCVHRSKCIFTWNLSSPLAPFPNLANLRSEWGRPNEWFEWKEGTQEQLSGPFRVFSDFNFLTYRPKRADFGPIVSDTLAVFLIFWPNKKNFGFFSLSGVFLHWIYIFLTKIRSIAFIVWPWTRLLFLPPNNFSHLLLFLNSK